MRMTLALLVLCALACSSVQDPADIDQPFVLRVGQSAVLESAGLRVHFEDVTGDSRCPSNSLILCVWEGDGAVLVRAERLSGYTLRDTLHTKLEPKTLALGDFALELQELAPYPETTDPIPQAEYQATFVLRLRD